MTNSTIDERPLDLRAGGLRLALRADLGGAIAGLWHGQTAILRSAEPALLANSRQSGCYPLVPYSNRVAYRKFDWQGRQYTTQPNFDDNPHSLHGVGWKRPWTVLVHSAAEAVLRYTHVPDAHWPFAFESTQTFTLSPQSLHLKLDIVNRSELAQPVGLGWHPYFHQRAQSRLQIDLSGRWESDAVGLPTHCVAQAGIDDAVSQLDLDHCFVGWHGPGLIRDEAFSLQLTSSMSRLVIYTPRGKGYFCVEPVSHVSNAIHMADPAAQGLCTLQPGERFEVWMTLEVSAL